MARRPPPGWHAAAEPGVAAWWSVVTLMWRSRWLGRQVRPRAGPVRPRSCSPARRSGRSPNGGPHRDPRCSSSSESRHTRDGDRVAGSAVLGVLTEGAAVARRGALASRSAAVCSCARLCTPLRSHLCFMDYINVARSSPVITAVGISHRLHRLRESARKKGGRIAVPVLATPTASRRRREADEGGHPARRALLRPRFTPSSVS